MSRLLCCLPAPRCRADMGAALSQPQEGEACEGAGLPATPPTMADVIRERKKKAGGAGLGTLRRRIAAAARRPRPDRGCEHARFIRSVVSSWRVAEVVLLCEELEAGAALRDLVTQAELAREPAADLSADLANAFVHKRAWDVEVVGGGGAWSVRAHRAVLAARSPYFRDLLARYPPSSGTTVPLEGSPCALTKAECEAVLMTLYTPHTAQHGHRWDRGGRADGDLDIISGDTANMTVSSTSSSCGTSGAARRFAALVACSPHTLHRDIRYLLHSGEYADTRLVFVVEGGSGSQYGFRCALELPCHRAVLASRSRLLRSVLSRRSNSQSCGASNSGGMQSVCVDESVLPRRFAAALLHAAYTDQVDLSLVGRNSLSPSSSNTNTSSSSRGGSPRPTSVSMLEDAFQMYDIGRFLEMAIVVQGCEDALVCALSPATVPHVLRWSSAPHASVWVHRQAMRYLRDEFPTIMAHAASAQLPRTALAEALASPFLQASEQQALRALLKWAERNAAAKTDSQNREPNVVWHTAHSVSVSVRGARRRELSEGLVREQVSSLLQLVRTEHLPPDDELLQQVIRRGLASPEQLCLQAGGERATADAWLSRGNYRPPRCLLPYLDELKALLCGQAVPAAEVARARRARILHRIPDTLYMVNEVSTGRSSSTSAPGGGAGSGAGGPARYCVSPRTLAALRARRRELRAGHAAQRALRLHSGDAARVHVQIALRAVRELSLPDECADLLLADDDDTDNEQDRERGGSCSCAGSGDDSGDDAPQWGHDQRGLCCRSGSVSGGGSLVSGAGSAPSPSPALHPHPHPPHDGGRTGSLWREIGAASDAVNYRGVWDEGGSLPGRAGGGAGGGGGGGGAHSATGAWAGASGALSWRVPDVAMAPNANTHLLTDTDYFRPPYGPPRGGLHYPHTPHTPAHHNTEYGGGAAGAGGGVLQLDLGDGATHTPRPGTRAQRERAAQHQQGGPGRMCGRRREDEPPRAAGDLPAFSAGYPAYQSASSAYSSSNLASNANSNLGPTLSNSSLGSSGLPNSGLSSRELSSRDLGSSGLANRDMANSGIANRDSLGRDINNSGLSSRDLSTSGLSTRDKSNRDIDHIGLKSRDLSNSGLGNSSYGKSASGNNALSNRDIANSALSSRDIANNGLSSTLGNNLSHTSRTLNVTERMLQLARMKLANNNLNSDTNNAICLSNSSLSNSGLGGTISNSGLGSSTLSKSDLASSTISRSGLGNSDIGNSGLSHNSGLGSGVSGRTATLPACYRSATMTHRGHSPSGGNAGGSGTVRRSSSRLAEAAPPGPAPPCAAAASLTTPRPHHPAVHSPSEARVTGSASRRSASPSPRRLYHQYRSESAYGGGGSRGGSPGSIA